MVHDSNGHTQLEDSVGGHLPVAQGHRIYYSKQVKDQLFTYVPKTKF